MFEIVNADIRAAFDQARDALCAFFIFHGAWGLLR